MKKLTRRGFTAAGIIAALDLKGCFSPSDNAPEAVYGPPEDFGSSATSSGFAANGASQAQGADDFDPSNNTEVDVYGPPPDDLFE